MSEAALAAFAKRAKPLELLPAALLHWSKRRGRALIPPIESAAHELSMQLPTQRYNDANPPLLWRGCSHYLRVMRASKKSHQARSFSAVGVARELLARRRAALSSFLSRGLNLVRPAHQAVAIALHIELTHVAFPVCGFGLLLASQLAAYLF